MYENCFAVHGVTLRVITGDRTIDSAGQRVLRHFPRQPSCGSADLELRAMRARDHAEIEAKLLSDALMLFSSSGTAAGDPIRQGWQCSLFQAQDQKIVHFHERALVILDERGGRVEAHLVRPEEMHPDITASLLHFAIAELLRQQGLYTLHAAALEKHGRGVLIPGASGRGKTTSCISLLRAGYHCLSDDHPLLRHSVRGIEILPFPYKTDVTDRTIDFFPELQAAKERLHQGPRKRYFYPEEFYANGAIERCDPVLILFPQVTDWPESYLEPMPKGRALEELLEAAVPMLDAEIARRQFETLADLVEKTACYQLFFGENVLDLYQLVDPLIEQG